MVWIGAGSNGFVTQGKNPVEIQTNGDTIITSTKGISMGGGNGTLSLSSWTDYNRTLTLNAQPIPSTNWAIQGNLSLEGKTTGGITANLGGKGISGGLTIKSGVNNIAFSGNATIGGNISISDGENTLSFGSNSTLGLDNSKKTITISGGTTSVSNLANAYVTITRGGGNNAGALTFSTKTNVVGDITRTMTLGSPSVGDLIINLNNGSTLTGNIQTARGSGTGDLNGNDFSANQITFDGATNATDVVFSGNITSYGTGIQQNNNLDSGDFLQNGNHITIAKGSINAQVYATRDGYRRRGYNTKYIQQKWTKRCCILK